MGKKKKDKYLNNIELDNRYCPICGDFVKAGSPFHRCNDKKISKIENERIKIEEKLEEDYDIDRSYCDKMDEADYYFDNKFYETEEEEDDF